MNKNKREVGVIRLFNLAEKKKIYLVFSAILSILGAIFMLTPYYAIYKILAELLINSSRFSKEIGSLCIDYAINGFIGLAVGYVFVYFSGFLSHVAAYRVLYEIRIKIVNHIGKLPLGFFNENSTGKIRKIISLDVEKIELFIAHQLPDLMTAISMTLIMIIIMFFVNPILAVATIIPVIIAFASQFSMMMGKKAKEGLKEYSDALESISASSIQYVNGMPSIKMFGQTVKSFRNFFETMTTFRDSCIRFTDNFQNGYVTFKVILMALECFIFPVGLFILSRNPSNINFTIEFIFFLIFVSGLASSIMRISSLANNVNAISEGVRRIDDILNLDALVEVDEFMVNDDLKNDIEFKNVYFSYDKKTDVLKNINFTAKEGTITALVGPSGSGKSTIAQLIPRFWDIEKGEILIGGVNIKKHNMEDLMDKISFVFQDSYLFSDSIYNNILIGNPDATYEEVVKVAEAAQCHKFIDELPQGFETKIGNGGVYLSGGEKQRISVARALLKNAPILILDEATAYADPENEYDMQLALSELIKDKTVIIIAHRLATIQNSDQIIVIKEGKIVERGKHNELLNIEGVYCSMWNSSQKSTQWKMSNRRED